MKIYIQIQTNSYFLVGHEQALCPCSLQIPQCLGLLVGSLGPAGAVVVIEVVVEVVTVELVVSTEGSGILGLGQVISLTTSANVNTTQLTGTPDGTVIVPTYDWQTFLYEHTKKLVGIKSFHHLRFSSTTKRYVFARLKSDSPEVDFNLLKDEWTPTATDLPERLTPSGLSPARQWYLFQKIREFCPEEATTLARSVSPSIFVRLYL